MATNTATCNDLVRGSLLEAAENLIILALPGTDYRLHLAVDQPLGAEPGTRIEGRIHARAKRVDVVRSGGRFIEPLYGRPRQLQGAVLAADPAANTITVNCACAFICELTANQNAADIPIGALVNFSIERGARFTPVSR